MVSVSARRVGDPERRQRLDALGEGGATPGQALAPGRRLDVQAAAGTELSSQRPRQPPRCPGRARRADAGRGAPRSRYFAAMRIATAARASAPWGTSSAHCGAKRSRSWTVGCTGRSRPAAIACRKACSRSADPRSPTKVARLIRDPATSRAVCASMANTTPLARRAGRPRSISARSKRGARSLPPMRSVMRPLLRRGRVGRRGAGAAGSGRSARRAADTVRPADRPDAGGRTRPRWRAA